MAARAAIAPKDERVLYMLTVVTWVVVRKMEGFRWKRMCMVVVLKECLPAPHSEVTIERM